MRISELENKLIKHAETTKSFMQPPFVLNEKINNMEVHAMNKPKSIMKKTVAIAAVLALFIITVTMTPLADSIRGFFSDIIRFDGAIVGTRYENATNDIKVDVLDLTSNDNGNVVIPLNLIFENPTEAPFPYIQEIAIAEYKILDSNNKKIAKIKVSANNAEKGIVNKGKALVKLSISDEKIISGNEYTLVIEKMYGLAKADAPLHITGTWECNFIR